MLEGTRPRPVLKVVMSTPTPSPPAPVPPQVTPARTSGAGYSYDPYDSPEERAEGCFVASIANILLGSFGLQDPGGFCSTYREWHVFNAGIWSGLKAKQFADIPDCPPLWEDEIQYYRGGAILSNVAKIYGFSASAALVGVFGWMNRTGILNTVTKIIPGA